MANGSNLDRCLLVFWATSLVLFVAALHSVWQGNVVDCLLAGLVHVICFPLIHREMPLAQIPTLGLLVVGLAVGYQAIDLSFDIQVLHGRPGGEGGGTDSLSGRQVAWLYYNTMLNALPVNLGLLLFLLVGQFGAVAGFTRSPATVRKRWIRLFAFMCAGNGGYLAYVVPRYIAIRASTTFDEGLFDGWHAVVLSRGLLFVALGAAARELSLLMREAPMVVANGVKSQHH